MGVLFEERFHYWADRLGYLTWGESASWGNDPNDIPSARLFLSEWQEIVVRDRNHPSIIAWTPLNETVTFTNPKQHRRFHRDLYALCKDLDPTRPVNDASGYCYTQLTDVEQEQNGIYNYDRTPKFNMRRIAGIFGKNPPA